MALVVTTTFLLAAVPAPNGGCGAATTSAVQGRAIAGYSGDQLDNAAAIMNAATAMGLDSRAQLLGVMTAMGESSLRNIGYGDWEPSGVINPDGSRTTSIGLFQQQDSWGSRDDRLNPTKAVTLFYQRLVEIDGWQNMPASEAIHLVQVNSDSNHYAKWEAPAVAVTAALTAPCNAAAGYSPQNGTEPGAWGRLQQRTHSRVAAGANPLGAGGAPSPGRGASAPGHGRRVPAGVRVRPPHQRLLP